MFELLGIFIAKCIQDKRRVDLPLARSFFKLMTSTPQSYGHSEEDSEPDLSDGMQSKNNQQSTEETSNDFSHVSNRHQQSSGNDHNMGDVGATSNSKEAELQMLVAEREEEITKDSGGEKEELVLEELGEGGQTEAAWFEGILHLEDLEEVNPHRWEYNYVASTYVLHTVLGRVKVSLV